MKGNIKIADGRLASFRVPVSYFKEGSQVVADCAMLGLASHGRSEREARSSIKNVIETFLEEIIEMGTLSEYLVKRGWTKHSSNGHTPRRTVSWVPPRIINATVARVRS